MLCSENFRILFVVMYLPFSKLAPHYQIFFVSLFCVWPFLYFLSSEGGKHFSNQRKNYWTGVCYVFKISIFMYYKTNSTMHFLMDGLAFSCICGTHWHLCESEYGVENICETDYGCKLFFCRFLVKFVKPFLLIVVFFAIICVSLIYQKMSYVYVLCCEWCVAGMYSVNIQRRNVSLVIVAGKLVQNHRRNKRMTCICLPFCANSNGWIPSFL